MRQQTTTNTVLEMYGPNDEVWHEPLGAMYDEPKRTAHLGHEREALQDAYDIRCENYGDCQGVEFRCVTETTTVTTS